MFGRPSGWLAPGSWYHVPIGTPPDGFSVKRRSGLPPIGYLIYDAAGHVAAQLSARDRSGLVCDSTGLSSDPNNNANIGGYSAYFGRYQVDAKAGTVTPVLEGVEGGRVACS
jgi:lipocalin-like protein